MIDIEHVYACMIRNVFKWINIQKICTGLRIPIIRLLQQILDMDLGEHIRVDWESETEGKLAEADPEAKKKEKAEKTRVKFSKTVIMFIW